MEKPTRRKFLFSTLAVLGGATLTAWIFRRNILLNTLFKTKTNPDISATLAPALDTDVCVLTSQQTEGPFYMPSPERSNIVEDRTGKALDLNIQVLRHPDCIPVENAVVEVWQGDAYGTYSGYPEQVAMDAWKLFMYVAKHGEKHGNEFRTTPSENTTFLRGLQRTDKDGWVSFKTIFPAWYLQRIPHIHFKIFIGEEEQLTSQFYFDDETQDRIFTTVEPYKEQGKCPTTVQNDGAVAMMPGKLEGVLLKPVWSDDSPLIATAKIGIKQS
jgi:protocatechuate 3,4-dioxygenase beta subunit